MVICAAKISSCLHVVRRLMLKRSDDSDLVQVDESVLSSSTLQQLRQALPMGETLKALADADQETLNKMPEGEVVREELREDVLTMRVFALMIYARYASVVSLQLTDLFFS